MPMDQEIARTAAEQANKLFGQWMPERWLSLFIDSYDDIEACRSQGGRSDKCECGGSENLGHAEGCDAHSKQPLRSQGGSEVQDTYLVGGPPDLKAMSGSVESDRIIQLHFRRRATDEDRKRLLDAINAKIQADASPPPSASQASCTPPEMDAVRHAFRAADGIDWAHLDQFIPDSGHGRFWKAVFAEVRAALSREES